MSAYPHSHILLVAVVGELETAEAYCRAHEALGHVVIGVAYGGPGSFLITLRSPKTSYINYVADDVEYQTGPFEDEVEAKMALCLRQARHPQAYITARRDQNRRFIDVL